MPCQPAGNGLPASKYLAPHVFRVALRNQRIRRVVSDQVDFGYQDADSGLTRLCTLAAEKLIQRILQHILSQGRVKVREYGLKSRQAATAGGLQAPECLPPVGPLGNRD